MTNKIYNLMQYSFFTIFNLLCSTAFAITEYRSAPIAISLETAMTMDENYSFNVKAASSDKNNALYQKFFSFTQMGPSINTQAVLGWYDRNNIISNVNNNGESNSYSTYSITASESITGLISGAMKIGQKNSSFRSAEFNLMTAKINARLEGAKSYILVQQALRTLEVRKAASKFAQEAYKQSQLLFNTGSVEKTRVDVLQTKAEAAAARLDEFLAEKDLQTALYDLGSKIGVQDISHLIVTLEETSLWEKLNPKILDFDMALKEALSSRSEINAAKENYNVVKLQLERDYFDTLPQANFSATYLNTSNDYGSSILNKNNNQFNYALNFSWAIWDSGVRAAQISETVNNKTKASIESEKILQMVTQDVQNALNNLNTAIKSLNDAKEASQSYEESFKLATIQFKTGDYNAINLIESQNRMTIAQVKLANVRSDLDYSWMKLQASLGELPKIVQ